ncbi:DUF6883 domain-containing protein [Chlorogloeopsis fritschii PCC 9212]|uniref:DUF6883 domain-containing protein n=1 Tax=Chlorogloeopsis fritschii PCC 6912 TaxID=211165 RepID=A0A433NMH2_CHLFR|nr:DUF6883 domain-containing protein [Chlorogloeopsis fritschii]RUR84251.1 hypothetical protein PCC6912_18450 [Chlorogloeopsis fritschii PCC 6912]
MLIPNAENTIADIRKWHDYCLNLEHNDGKHKARLFSSIFGMSAENAEELPTAEQQRYTTESLQN